MNESFLADGHPGWLVKAINLFHSFCLPRHVVGNRVVSYVKALMSYVREVKAADV